MLAVQNSARQSAGPVTAGRRCPNCGRSMYLARMAPGTDGASDQRIYRCGECGVTQAENKP